MYKINILMIIFFSFLSIESHAGPLPPAQLPPKGMRTMVFVSDLHMGVGRDPKKPEQWHKTEDFRWHKEFSDFLKKIANGSAKGKIDLVLVGDIFELWQSLDMNDCAHDDLGKSFGCTEQEAILRAKRVVTQHKAVFSALSEFAKDGDNRVTLLAGNHDVALAFKGVRDVVLNAFPNLHSGKIRIASEGYWMSADGKIIAEHGQQIGRDPNKFEGWPTTPFKEKDNIRYLLQPWGEEFVQRVFNQKELEYPTIDNLSSEAIGIKYVAADRSLMGTLEELGDLLNFVFFQTSFDQAGQLLGKDGVPVWNLIKIKEDMNLNTSTGRWTFLIESRPKDDPIRNTLAASVDKLSELANFDNDMIISICDRRWAVKHLNKEKNTGIELCADTGKLGAIAERIGDAITPRIRNRRFRNYLEDLRKSIPETDRPTRNFTFYLYGHTHKEENNYKPFGSREGWAPIVFNDGAWQRTANEQVFCSILKNKGIAESDALEQIQPEDLPPCYPFVSASYNDEGELSMNLWYWVQRPGQRGDIRSSCTELPEIHQECK